MNLATARPTRVHLILLGVIVLFAAAIRIHQLTVPGFWFDELSSVALACGHWKSFFFPYHGYFPIAPDTASPTAIRPLYELFFEADSHPPLYAFVLRGWWLFFGMSDVSCRALSVVASLLCVVLIFDVARLIVGPTSALWASAMLAASPSQLRYAQETRSYAMLVLLGLAACDAMLRIHLLGGNRKRYGALAIFSSAALLTHYFVIGAVAALGVFAFWKSSQSVRRNVVLIIVTAFAILLASRLPIVLAHKDAFRTATPFLDEPRDGLIGRTLGRSATLPMQLILQPRDDAMIYGAPAAILLILPFIYDRRRPGLLLCGLWSLGTIGLVAASDIILGQSALLYIRYTLVATPAIIIISVTCADIWGKWVRHLLPACAVIGAILAIPNVYEDEMWEKIESRQWSADVKSHVHPGDVLVVASAANMGLYSASIEYLTIAYYVNPKTYPVAILDTPATEIERAEIWSHRNVWVANCYHGAPLSFLLGPCHVVQDGKVRFGCGNVVRIERDAPAISPATALSASRHST